VTAPMRVLVITSHRDSLNSIRPEAELFIGLARAGVAVTMMTQGDSVYREPMLAAGIRLVDFEPRRKLSWRAIRAIRAELKRGRHDILHMFNNKAIANGLVAAMGLPVRAVTYRGAVGNISRFDPTSYLTHLNPRVDRIVCVAEAVRRSLIAEVSDVRKLVTIYKGHDLAWYRDVRPVDRTDFGIPADCTVVICVANNRPRKGVSVLIDAATRLPADDAVHFVLIGRGMTDEQLGPQLVAAGCAGRFHCLGYRTDVLELTAACDIAVLPAIRGEGLPKTVIEAMALGLAPVITPLGGSAELVVDGESGLVVPAGDAQALAGAISALSRDPERRRRMGDAARQRLDRRFRVDDAVAAHAALYRELLRTPARAAA
jgi:L-malate glycosyltransferase